MIRTSTRRVATSLVAAAAALALVAPGAGAATGAPARFSGAAEALTLDLTLTAPAELLAPLGVSDGVLRQSVSSTLVELSSAGDATATSRLLSGLRNEAISSTDGATSDRRAIAEQDVAGILRVGAGTMEYTADATQNVSRSFSELANLSVSLAPLFEAGSQLPEEVRSGLQDAVGTATGTVNELVGELNGALGEVETVVNEAAGAVEEGTGIDIPDVAPDALPQVPDITQVNLLDVRKMWSESEVATEAGSVVSTAHAGIAEASLLGGLVQVPAFQYETIARTNGEPGGAFADTVITTIAVKVAGGDVVAVEGTELSVGDFSIDLNDPELGELDGEVLAPVTDLLSEILDAVGVSVAQGEGTTSIAEDGSRAEASTSALALSVHPLNAAGAASVLGVDLELLPNRAVVAASPDEVEEPAPPAAAPPVSMPRTGGGALPVVLGGLAMAGAAVLRRRV